MFFREFHSTLWIYLSYLFSNHGYIHIKLIKHVLQYQSGILELGLRFDKKVNTSDDLFGYINSDLAKSKTDWKSTRDFVFILARAVIIDLSQI